MLLKRVSYPCRYSDMIPRFGRPVSVLSLITNHTLDYIYENHGHLITQWNRNILNPRALQSYADSISRKGAPLNNCFGFIDGTVRPISRPGHAQRVVYNGHKRVHSLKFQSLALPNGLIGNIFGPIGKYYFPGLYCLKTQVGKMAIFGPKPWVNPFGKMTIFRLFELLVFIA